MLPRPSVYFDYNATTPLDPSVAEAMAEVQAAVFANPSSIHGPGRAARALLDDARERVAACWRCKPTEVLFTSGATEANNLAVLGTARRRRDQGRHIVLSAIEHPAVLAPCEHLARREGFELSLVRPQGNGRLDVAHVLAALRPDTVLVSVMAANNEIGTLQPVSEIGAACAERGIVFHCDAAQWFGKMPVEAIHEFHADLVSLSAHKFHGPKGVGALFVRSGVALEPLLFGGGQENDHRPGTENLTAIIGLALAVEKYTRPPVFDPGHLRSLTEALTEAAVQWPGVTVLGRGVATLPNTVALAVEGVDGTALVAALDLEGICASSGSACSAGATSPSHVLSAVGRNNEAHALLRFSLGRASTRQEVDLVVGRIPPILARLREHALARQNL